MRGYLLDTQTIRYWFDGESGQYPAVKAAAERRPADSPLYISVITLGEIEFGHAQHPEGAGPKREDFVRFVQERFPQVLDLDKHVAKDYGRIRAHLAARFPPKGGWNKKKRAEQMFDPIAARELGIDENDLWIAAQAVERNLILVTSDKMQRIRQAIADIEPDFVVEDWASE